MSLGIVAAIVYGVIAIAGGVMGYQTAQSKMSLIAGVACGSLLLISGVLQWQGIAGGTALGAVVTTVLIVAMIARYAKTRKFMPAGLMTILGAIALFAIVNQIVAIGY
jgi:uncharacterized membrane protein (UPF0136 family)